MNFYEKGIAFIKTAQREEQKQKYEEALRSYIRGIEYFLTGLKCNIFFGQPDDQLDDKNARTKEIVQQNLIQIMERAEEVKKLKEDNKKQAITSEGASSKNKSDEREKFRSSLESAILKEKPNIKFSDVAGLEDAKKALEEAIILPVKYPQLFVGKRQPWRAVLLYGPPGTGKSYLAKACASVTNSTFFSVSSADLMSKYQGESEKLIRELFQMAIDNAPSIIFIDEIDAIGTSRSDDETESIRRIKNEFLIQMENMKDKKGVLVLGATNRPYDLDMALRRRFDRRIYIPLPDEIARREILKIHAGQEANLKDEDYANIAKETDGYSGADLSIVVRDALMQPVRRAMQSKYFKETEEGTIIPCTADTPGAKRMTIFDIKNPSKLKIDDTSLQDFKNALSKVKPSVSLKDIEEHIRFTKQYGEGEQGGRKLEHFRENISKSRTEKVVRREVITSSDDDEEEETRKSSRKPVLG